jgi:hypothetical protein
VEPEAHRYLKFSLLNIALCSIGLLVLKLTYLRQKDIDIIVDAPAAGIRAQLLATDDKFILTPDNKLKYKVVSNFGFMTPIYN